MSGPGEIPARKRHGPATVTAISRAAALIAAHNAGDTHGCALPVAQARRDGTVLLLAMAVADQAARMARAAYGERAQFELDAFALDASFFCEREVDGNDE